MARDLFHQVVKEALEAEGWTITADPFIIKTIGLRLEIDLAAEQVFAAEKGKEEIVVEVKSFLSKSKLADFYEAKGKYDTYRYGLEEAPINKKLYLAIEETIFNTFFQKPLIKTIVEKDHIDLIIFNNLTKKIVKWIVN
jgi:XisH protein